MGFTTADYVIAALAGAKVATTGHGGAIAGAFGNSRAVSPTIPKPPSQDTAAQTQQENNQILARQKGVLATIYAGNNASAPTVKSSTTLGV